MNWAKANFRDPLNAPAGGLTDTNLRIAFPEDVVVRKSSEPEQAGFAGATPNLAAAVGLAVGRTIREFNFFTRPEAGGPIYLVSRHGIRGTLDLYGSGVPETPESRGGHGGSYRSALGGTLTAKDLDPGNPDPIRHAWKLTADLQAIGLNDEDGLNTHVKPAVAHDSMKRGKPKEAFYGSTAPEGFESITASGTLLAIPHDVDIEELGIETRCEAHGLRGAALRRLPG